MFLFHYVFASSSIVKYILYYDINTVCYIWYFLLVYLSTKYASTISERPLQYFNTGEKLLNKRELKIENRNDHYDHTCLQQAISNCSDCQSQDF